MALSCHYLKSYRGDSTPGHPGNPGAHNGIGLLAVADWCVENVRVDEFETEAAATPAQTIESAIKRIASFMIGNPFCS
jgi:hypothetical protein